jgi:hypothetical protein
MEELLNMISTDDSPSQISDKIKEILFAKSAERVDIARPIVANSMFGENGSDEVDEVDENN